MDIDKYESLLFESYETIRHYYKNNLIVIKPHPRESVQVIKNIIDSNVIIPRYRAVFVLYAPLEIKLSLG